MSEENVNNQEQEQEINEHCCEHHENGDQEHKCGCGHHHHEGGCCGGHHDECQEKKIPEIEDIPDMEFPAPDLLSLTESIATQAMVSLGVLPNPLTGKAVKRPNQAKHLIDSIQLIYDKTNGNRTDEETKIIETMIHELHMMYIRAK